MTVEVPPNQTEEQEVDIAEKVAAAEMMVVNTEIEVSNSSDFMNLKGAVTTPIVSTESQ